MTCNWADFRSEVDTIHPFRLSMSEPFRLACGLPAGKVVAPIPVGSIPWPTSGSPVCPLQLPVPLSSHRKWRTRRKLPFRKPLSHKQEALSPILPVRDFRLALDAPPTSGSAVESPEAEDETEASIPEADVS